MAYVVPPTLKKNSYSTTLTAGITAVATSIPVADVTPFYDAAGALITEGIVLGFNLGGATPEEITITGCSVAAGVGGAGNLTGAVRAVNTDVNTGGTALGPAFAWTSGTKIGVMMSIGIYNILINDIIAHQAAIALNAPLASPTFTGVITIPDAASSLRRVSVAANGELLIGNGTGYTPATLTQGTNITITNAAGQITIAAAAGGASFWTALTATTDFATTGASTSTITMNTNQTANIKIGARIKMTFNGATQYGQVTALTSSLLTFRGQPITTGAGLLTALSWGDQSRAGQISFSIPGYYESVSTATAINDMIFLPSGYLWDDEPVYFIGLDIQNGTADSGGTQGIVNLVVNGNLLDTSNSTNGLSISGTSLVRSVVDINATIANTLLSRGQYLEIKVTKGTNGDALNLLVTALYVIP